MMACRRAYGGDGPRMPADSPGTLATSGRQCDRGRGDGGDTLQGSAPAGRAGAHHRVHAGRRVARRRRSRAGLRLAQRIRRRSPDRRLGRRLLHRRDADRPARRHLAAGHPEVAEHLVVVLGVGRRVRRRLRRASPANCSTRSRCSSRRRREPLAGSSSATSGPPTSTCRRGCSRSSTTCTTRVRESTVCSRRSGPCPRIS